MYGILYQLRNFIYIFIIIFFNFHNDSSQKKSVFLESVSFWRMMKNINNEKYQKRHIVCFTRKLLCKQNYIKIFTLNCYINCKKFWQFGIIKGNDGNCKTSYSLTVFKFSGYWYKIIGKKKYVIMFLQHAIRLYFFLLELFQSLADIFECLPSLFGRGRRFE